jgi:sugar lactone lactonase YvrE
MSTPWTTYQGGPQRNGQSALPVCDTSAAASGQIYPGSITQAPVFGSDGTLYLGMTDGRIYAYRDSDILWCYAGPAAPTGLTLSPDGTTIYYGHGGGLTAIDVTTGLARWTYSAYPPVLTTPVIGDDGNIYAVYPAISSYPNALRGLRPDGTPTTFCILIGSPANTGPLSCQASVLYQGATTGGIYNISTISGSPAKSLNLMALPTGSRSVTGSITLAADGSFYAPFEYSNGGKLAKIDANGVLVWCYALNEALIGLATPALSPDGSVAYIGAASLHAVSTNTGQRLWTRGSTICAGSPIVTSDGFVYVISQGLNAHGGVDSSQNALLVLNGETGDVSARIAMPKATGAVSVAPDGSIYAVCADGSLFYVPGASLSQQPSQSGASVIYTGVSYPPGIQVFPLSDPQPSLLAQGSFSPSGLAVDPQTQDVYWTDGPSIQKYSAATEKTAPVATGLPFNPAGLALDLARQNIYCCDSGGGGICVVSTVNGAAQTLITGLKLPVALALDLASDLLFWAEYGSGCLQQASLSDLTPRLVVASLNLPQSVVIDPEAGKIYWAAKTSIETCAYDGSARTTVATLPAAQPSSNSRKLAIDTSAQRLYWSDQASQSVQSAGLDGSSPATVIDHSTTAAFGTPTVVALGQS